MADLTQYREVLGELLEYLDGEEMESMRGGGMGEAPTDAGGPALVVEVEGGPKPGPPGGKGEPGCARCAAGECSKHGVKPMD
jgi:hypothetical protein